MRDRDHLDGLAPGGTELPLLLNDSERIEIPLSDSMKIHAEAAVSMMFS